MEESILIIGAGGHGQVVVEALRRMQEKGEAVRPLGFVDDDEFLIGSTVSGLQVLANRAQITAIVYDALIVAIGDNRMRSRIFRDLALMKQRFAVARHPRSIVSPDVRIGKGTMICAGVIINTQAVIGKNVILNTGCTIDHHNYIGDHVHIAPGANLGGNVVIAEGALVGIGATIMAGKHVGAWSVVGAASLVLEDVPEGAVVAGVPAKRIK